MINRKVFVFLTSMALSFSAFSVPKGPHGFNEKQKKDILVCVDKSMGKSKHPTEMQVMAYEDCLGKYHVFYDVRKKTDKKASSSKPTNKKNGCIAVWIDGRFLTIQCG